MTESVSALASLPLSLHHYEVYSALSPELLHMNTVVIGLIMYFISFLLIPVSLSHSLISVSSN